MSSLSSGSPGVPQPPGDVEVVLGAAALELGTAGRADVGQDARECAPPPPARRVPVVALHSPGVWGVAVESKGVRSWTLCALGHEHQSQQRD